MTWQDERFIMRDIPKRQWSESTKALNFVEGEPIRMDTDNSEWGRIVGTGRIIVTPSKRACRVLVHTDMRNADIIVYKSECFADEPDEE